MSVRRSLAWMLSTQGGLLVLQFGGSIALARVLTPYEMGIYALASSVIGILAVLQAFGLGLFVVREVHADDHTLVSAFTMNMVLSSLLAAGTVGLSIFGGAFLNEPGVRNVMLVLAVIPLITILDFRPTTMMERASEFRTIAGLNVIRALASTAVTLSLAYTGHSYMSIAWGGVAGTVVGAVGAMIVGRRHVSFRLGLTGWRTILQFGLQQLAIHGVNNIAARLSEFMLGRMLGLEALGLWGRATNLNNLVWNNIHMVAGRVMMVNLAEQYRAGHSLRAVYLRTVEVLTAVLWPSFAGLAILAGPFISLVYGPAWVGAAAPLAGIAVSAMITVSLTMTWEVFIVCQETGRQSRFEFIRTGVGLVLFLAGCLFNLTVVSLARVGEALFSVVLYRADMQRMTDTAWPDYAIVYRRSAIVCVAACAPALVLMTAYGWSPSVPASLVATAVVSGVVLWLIALMLLDHPLSEEIGRFVAKGRQVVGLTPP